MLFVPSALDWNYLAIEANAGKHVPCFYRVMKTQVEVGTTGKCFDSFFEFSLRARAMMTSTARASSTDVSIEPQKHDF